MLVPQACPELVSFVESERVGFRIWWPLIFCPLKLLWCTGRYNHKPLPIWRPFYWTRGAADPLRTNKEISIFFLPSLCLEVNKSCDVTQFWQQMKAGKMPRMQAFFYPLSSIYRIKCTELWNLGRWMERGKRRREKSCHKTYYRVLAASCTSAACTHFTVILI